MGARQVPPPADRRHLQNQAQRRLRSLSGKPRSSLRPQTRSAPEPVVIVQGNGPIHTGKATRAAPAARAHWPSVGWPPELNDIETVWRDLQAHHPAQQTFTDRDNPDRTIHEAIEALNVGRKPSPLANQRLCA